MNRVRRMTSERPPLDVIDVSDVEMDALSVDPPLSESERSICENAAIIGYAYFSELGWDSETEQAFLSRPRVRLEIERIQQLFQSGQSILAKQAFMSRLKLAKMQSGALSIIQRVLRGQIPDASGKIPDPRTLPAAEQYAAALDVLNMSGVNHLLNGAHVTNILEINAVVDRRSLDDDGEAIAPGDPAATLSREKVRNILEAIIAVSDSTDQQIKQLESARATPVKRKRKKRKRREG